MGIPPRTEERPNISPPVWSRRAFIRSVGGTLALLLLDACTRASGPSGPALPGWFAFTVASGDLWVVRGDGSDRHRVTSSGDGVDFSPTWAPDASQLAFRHS